MSDDPNAISEFAKPQKEPLFMAISREDPAFQTAHDRAAATLPAFITHLQNRTNGFYSAKLRFRDPDLSERLGEERLLFLWLTDVYYYEVEKVFSGAFLEVPPGLQKWHQNGQYLAFDPADIFDWMVLVDGHLHGGFTLRATREKLPESEREAYDQYIGVSVYEPLPS